ncbi:nitrate- and nitrite sensing domain-containing protein [Streptantibioticus rubrisoli]|uniref:histidine kinase n=1 Tax=Streptantibioticus rubrisoli TaxID=1387313 RepID=A0ABT1P9E9_9ACTN|nr:nitrate- and nitrite sensing domain-containing protein [Streptantibioticus rubrisoli]MCQ4041960.1 nitrate- and nitrite sensing domain-containing protein [Streptantibioticus rubrisoli]
MRFRGKTIRRKIVALLVVPLVSLIGIWAFAALITGRGVFGLLDVKDVTNKIGYPVENTVEALSAERRAALVYLADPRNSQSEQNLRTAESDTDKSVSEMRANSADASLRGKLDSSSRQRLDDLVKQAGELDGLRRQVSDGRVSRADAFAGYNDIVEPYYDFFLGLNTLQNVQLDRQARVLTELSEAREAISREDALYSAAQVAGRMTRAEQRGFGDAVAEQREIYDKYPQLLPDADRALFDNYWRSSTGTALHNAEERILDADPAAATGQVSPQTWQSTTSSVLSDLSALDRQVAENYKQRVRPYAISVLVRAGIAGGFGLLAVLVSVGVSLRIGRGLARDLSKLRKEAQEASGTRLPRVMRRLAAGEEVDVESEVPRLDYPDDEMGQVGRALNTLQRAAVEAAVRQADMRRGVSDVFVNLARRNQVLLHRQLALLDTMERRTEDAQELADLFRLDHMTTRMRRHAEGLVILSGSAPSRQWRKPVRLMDVVRAAVAEVEDYERVEVRRLPRIAVVGAAVADLTHLLAELVENATVFSPPHTTVQVHGERVANGFVLEIDDRGLGMTADALLDANLRLAETPEFELSDTDRLGLFVVSRLAQRQGVRVSLRQSPYGGTTAVVLVPTALLTEAEDAASTGEQPVPGAIARLAAPPAHPRFDGELPDEIAVPVPGEPTEQAFREWGILPASTADGEPATAEPVALAEVTEQHQQAADPADHKRDDAADGKPTPLPRRRRSPVLVADRGRTLGPTRPRLEPAATDEPEPAATDRPAPTALPRRVRQASLAPQLREDDTAARQRPSATDATARAPYDRDADEVRSRMASLQRGWQRGRAEADDSSLPDHTDGRSANEAGTTSEGDGR